VFATINHPHEYYQLSITPFLAVVSAKGLRWLLGVWKRRGRQALEFRITFFAAFLLVVGAPLTYLVWLRQPSLNANLLEFQTMCAGKWPTNRPAMLFVAESVNPTGGETPSYLYVARLWGFGMTVRNESDARRYYDKFAPAFPGLELVVFYGFDQPSWVTNASFALKVQDEQNRLYAFSLVSDP
jgi:hypothetical protein